MFALQVFALIQTPVLQRTGKQGERLLPFCLQLVFRGKLLNKLPLPRLQSPHPPTYIQGDVWTRRNHLGHQPGSLCSQQRAPVSPHLKGLVLSPQLVPRCLQSWFLHSQGLCISKNSTNLSWMGKWGGSDWISVLGDNLEALGPRVAMTWHQRGSIPRSQAPSVGGERGWWVQFFNAFPQNWTHQWLFTSPEKGPLVTKSEEVC